MTNVRAMFLFQGFTDKNECLNDTGMGQVDAAYHIQHWADRIEAVYVSASEIQDFPGVFDYEVTESFGEWLRANLHAPEPQQADQLIDLVKAFFRQDAEITPDLLQRMRAAMNVPETV